MPRTAAIIGLGAAGTQHIAAYEAAGVEVTHLCDLYRQKMWRTKSKVPALTLAANWRSVIGKTDFLSIASYDHCHAEQVIAGLAAGQKVFCEKPLCLSLEELIQIKKTARSCHLSAPSGVVEAVFARLGVNYPLRHVDLFKALKRDIEAGWFGDIYFISATYHWGRRHKMGEWRGENPYSMMMGGGIHMVDLVRWMSGESFECCMPLGFDDSWCMGIHTLGTIHVDSGSDRGDHWHEITIRGTKFEATVRNEAPTDKQACLKEFIAGYDDPTIFEVTEACLRMSR